jgi:hypothetical protein
VSPSSTREIRLSGQNAVGSMTWDLAGGPLADVEEGDIYKVDEKRRFYLNTYKGSSSTTSTTPRTRSGCPDCPCSGTRSRC